MAKSVEMTIGGTLNLLFREIVEEELPIALVTLSMGAFTVTARGDHMAYTLPVGMQVRVQVAYVDAAGNPASVDGAVTWSSSDPSIAEVAADASDSLDRKSVV